MLWLTNSNVKKGAQIFRKRFSQNWSLIFDIRDPKLNIIRKKDRLKVA